MTNAEANGRPRPDFFGLDRESQDALLALGKIWRDRAAVRALLKVIGAVPCTM